MKHVIVRTCQKDPNALQGHIQELAKVVDEARENALPPSTSLQRHPEQNEPPVSTEVVNMDMPNVDANDGEQKGVESNQFTYIFAPPDETSEDTSDDGASEIRHDAADKYANKTAEEPTNNTTNEPTRNENHTTAESHISQEEEVNKDDMIR